MSNNSSNFHPIAFVNRQGLVFYAHTESQVASVMQIGYRQATIEEENEAFAWDRSIKPERSHSLVGQKEVRW